MDGILNKIKQAVQGMGMSFSNAGQNAVKSWQNAPVVGGLAGQVVKQFQAVPQAMQQYTPTVNSGAYNVLQRGANFQVKLPTPQYVSQLVKPIVTPVVNYGKNLAGFAGLGPQTPDSISRREVFAQTHPVFDINSPESTQQAMDMAFSFSGSTAGPKTAAILAKKFPVESLKKGIDDFVNMAFKEAKDYPSTITNLDSAVKSIVENNPTIQTLKALKAKLSKKMIEVSGAPGNWWKTDYAHVQKMKQDAEVGPVLSAIQTHVDELKDMIINKGKIKVAAPVPQLTQTESAIINKFNSGAQLTRVSGEETIPQLQQRIVGLKKLLVTNPLGETDIKGAIERIQAKIDAKIVPAPVGGTTIPIKVSTPQKVIIQLPKDLQGAKPRYGYGSNNYQLKFQSDVDKALYVVAQPKPSARDADYLKYLQGIFPELSVSEIRQMGQNFRNTVIKPLAANGEGDILNIPSFSDNLVQSAKKVETPFVNPNPVTTSAWEQSLVDSGIAPKAPVVEPPVAKPPVSHIQTADEFAASQKAWEQQFAPKEKVPGMQFEPGALPETPVKPSVQADIINMKAGSKGGVIDSIKQSFADWVNARNASKLEGYIKQKDFQALDAEGITGIFKFQAGDNQGLYGKVREFFDAKYNELFNAGLTFNYKNDYLPQLWKNTQEEVSKVFPNRRLSLKPSFAFQSIIKDYQTGIDAGLTPKFNTISELAGWYEGRANRALADFQFFKTLGKEGIIEPTTKAPYGWEVLDPNRFPKFKIEKGDKVFSGTFSAPKEVGDMINNYLKDPSDKWLNSIANFASRAKNITLTFGIPWTAINMHGVNILARHTLLGTGGNPITRLLTGAKYLLNQKASQHYLDKTLEIGPRAMKKGLTIGTEGFQGFVDSIDKGLKAKFAGGWHDAFERALFDKMIPALKISSWQNLANDLAKKMPKDRAEREAAKIVNNVYGGINWEAMGRDRNIQNWARVLVLAPDWGETTVRLGGNLAKSLVKGGPEMARYRTMNATILGSYVAANVANLLSSGHLMYQNDAGHTMEIEIGYTSEGQKRYLRPYGTAVDFVRLPYDTALSLAKGDPTPIFKTFTNRLSIPLASTGHLLFNTNYRGDPLYGKTNFGEEMPFLQSAANVGGEVISGFGFPSFGKQVLLAATGQQGAEASLTQGLELPLRYTGGAYSKTQKTVEGVAKAEGVSGKELYDINQSVKGQTFSKNQSELLRQSGIDILPDILQLKDQNHTLNEIKKVQEEIIGGNMTEAEGNIKIEDLLNGLEAPKKTTDLGFIKTASADSGFPAASLVGSSTGTPLVGTAQAADPKSALQGQMAESLARLKVQTTGQPQEANGQIFYTNENGNGASVPLDRPIYQPVMTGDPVVDKMELQDMAASYTAKINDVQTLFRIGKYTKEEYVAKVNELTAQKSVATGKYAKPKKIKFPKLKLSAPKKISIKALKFAPLKINLVKQNAAKIKVAATPKLRTTPITLKKLNLKFKNTLPKTIKGLK